MGDKLSLYEMRERFQSSIHVYGAQTQGRVLLRALAVQGNQTPSHRSADQ